MKYKIALAQISPRLGEIEANFKIHKEYIQRAKKEKARLLVFPELSLTGYFLKDLVEEVALSLDSPVIQSFAELSRDLDLVLSFAEIAHHNYYISAAYFSQGKILHVHRKVYLPTYGMFEDGRFFGRGDRIRAFDTPLGRMSLLICEDLWHPSTSYIATQDGAEIILSVASSPSRGVEEEKLEVSRTYETFNRMYARLYGVYNIFVNRVGFEDGIGFWGGSEVVDPFGDEAVKAPYFEEGLTFCDVDLNHIRHARSRTPLLRDEDLALTLRELERIQNEKTRNPY